MNCDWAEIKSDYITDSKSSYRKIAEKYGVSFNTLQCRAKAEEWAKLKKQTQDEITTKTVKKKIKKQVDRATRIMDVADKLLDTIEKAIGVIVAGSVIDENGNPTIVIDGKTMKQLSSALKDIKDVQGCKTELDIREQEARIRNLEKAAESSDDKPNEITITIAGGEKSWAE